MCRPLVILAVLLSTTACTTSGNRWQDPRPGAPPATSRTIVFAPVSVGSLARQWPDAPLELAHRLALDIDLRVRDADGLVGEQLPDAADPAWNGRRAGAAAAHLVVLGRLTACTALPRQPADHDLIRRVRVQAELIGVDAAGAVVFRRTASGEGSDEGGAKMMGPANLPESRAAWDALGNALPALRAFIDHQQDAPAPPVPAGGIAVTIASVPPQADILVDGRFMGSTPQTITLPARPARLRLERPGHRPWERQITPTAGLTINPVLEAAP